MGVLDIHGLQSSLFFESPEEIYARVFRELKPRTAAPEIRVEFCRFANADSFIRFKDGWLEIRISDLLAGAPSPVLEALAHILLGKLYRKPIARIYAHRYRLYLNRRDVRRQAHLVKQIRGRKFISGPKGEHFDPSHNAIIISRIFDRKAAPALALEYVMYHEMLHLRFPVDHTGARRRVHTKEFREAEKKFPQLKDAKELLKRL